MSKEAKFELGMTVITATAQHTFEPEFVQACLHRHAQGDWGDLDPSDAKANDAGLEGEHPDRLHSVYKAPGEGELWIITEWDRSVTTALLPSDY